MNGRPPVADDFVVDVSVVIPCLDEEAAVGRVVDAAWRGIERAGRTGEVIVVDNGSTDASAEVAARHGARVIREPRRGYGSAYLAGLAAAHGEAVVMGDADETYDLSDLEPFLLKLEEGNDLVLGSRFRGRIHPGAMPWLHQHVGNPILTAILNRFFRIRVSDAHCGLRALQRSAIPALGLQSTGMEFASEMVLKAAKRGLRVDEVPIEYFPRAGDSKLNTFRDGWRHLRFMLVHSPTWLFLVPGSLLVVLGVLPLLALAGGPIELFGRPWQIHAMIAASILTLVGAQVIQLAVFARTYAILYLEEEDPAFERLWRRVRLEHGLAVGALLLLAGVAVLAAILTIWALDDFGALAYEHQSLLGLTLVGLGVQTIFASFFLSVLGLRRHLVDGPPAHPASAERRACLPRLAAPREDGERPAAPDR